MGEEGFEPRTVEFLKGDGPLASKKWCKGTIASVIKANSHRKEIDTQKVYPHKACA